jgi:glycosyltransferase involved in cell wall biosynthesis
MKTGKRMTEIAPPAVDVVLTELSRRGYRLRLERKLGKSAFLIVGENGRFVLKLPVPPKNSLQRVMHRLLGGNLKFRREADFYESIEAARPPYHSLPLIMTDGATYLLLRYVEGASPIWTRTPRKTRAFLDALVAFQNTLLPSRRSWRERKALQLYFGVNGQILRFAARIARETGWASLARVVRILWSGRCRQSALREPIHLHNDILYNVLEDEEGKIFVMDFEEVTRERRWVLIDVIEAAFAKDTCTVDQSLLIEYLTRLSARVGGCDRLHLPSQVRLALLFRVTHAIVSKSTAPEEKRRLLSFYRSVVLNDERFGEWYEQNLGEMRAPAPAPSREVVVTVPDLAAPGGIASYFSALQPHFSRRVRLVTRGSRAAGGNPAARLLRDYTRFVREIRRPACRLVQINMSLGAAGVLRDAVYVLLARANRRRVVLFVRGWNERYAQRLERRGLPLFRKIFFRCHVFIVLGRDFEERLREWGWRGRVVRETTAVDEALVEGFTVADVEERSRASEVAPRLLFLGRIEEAKGIFPLLGASRLLREDGMPCRVAYAGSGSALEALRDKIAADGFEEVEALGRVQGEAKRDLLRGSDIFVLPTRHGEGLPNAMLEAMAVGLPVLACPVGGIKDHFEDGTTGFLLQEGGAAEIARRVAQIWRNPEVRLRMARANFHYGQTHFRASEVARRVERLWDEEIARGFGQAEPLPLPASHEAA